MKIFIYPLLIAVTPLILGVLLKLSKNKVIQKLPIFFKVILIIACGIFCTFASMIVCVNGLNESMTTQQPRCGVGAAIFFPIGIISTVISSLINIKKINNFF